MAVEIVGTNFRLPATPPPGVTSGISAPTVRVFFGGVESASVDVLASTLVLAMVPARETVGAVDILVQNIDDDGVLIPGETVTAAAAFTYEIARLTAEYESDLVRMVRALLRRLKQQTIAKEVTRPVHTDYDEETGDELNIAKFGAFPGITLMGPKMRQNRFYSSNEQPTISIDLDNDGDPETFIETRVAYVVDLIFTVVAVSDRDTEVLNLMANFVQFMHRNKMIGLLRLPSNPALGQAMFELDFTDDGEPQMPGAPNNSNVHQWSAEIVIRGVPIEELSGIGTDVVPGTAVPRHAVVGEGKTALDVIVDHAEQIGDD
jgi:hypothetical protein